MQFNFDASQVAPQAAPEPVPADRYKVSASKAEMEPTKEAGGQMLKLEFTILEGPFTGRKLFERLNLVNKSEMAMQIAYGTLSAVCRAVGQIQVNDTAELLGKPCIVDVALRPAEGNYGPQNKITKYHSLSGVPLEQIGGMPGGAAAAPPAWVPPGSAVASPVAPGAPGNNWAHGAPVLAPPPAAVVPVAPAAPIAIERLTAKANGATMEQFIAGGWTKDAMIQQGYLEVVQPAPPAAPAAPMAPPPVAGASWAPPAAASAPAAAPGPRPPWMPQQ
jgi:hypothetical protein